MDTVFSTRLDDDLVERLDRMARETRLPKKRIVQEALARYLADLGDPSGEDVLARTAGAWSRRERPATTVRKARRSFREGLVRQHRKKR